MQVFEGFQMSHIDSVALTEMRTRNWRSKLAAESYQLSDWFVPHPAIYRLAAPCVGSRTRSSMTYFRFSVPASAPVSP